MKILRITWQFLPPSPRPADWLAHVSPWTAYLIALTALWLVAYLGVVRIGMADRFFSRGRRMLTTSCVTVPVAAAAGAASWAGWAWLAGPAPLAPAAVPVGISVALAYLISSGWATDSIFLVALSARSDLLIRILDELTPSPHLYVMSRTVRSFEGIRTWPLAEADALEMLSDWPSALKSAVAATSLR